MSVRRFKRLEAIRKMQENLAAIQLATQLQALNAAEQQRDLLNNYLESYLKAGIPDDIHQIKHMAMMRQQLRTAIGQQAGQIAAAEAVVEQARGVWIERHQATLSLTKLIERRQQAELIEDNRRQQQELDAWAIRRAFDRLQLQHENS